MFDLMSNITIETTQVTYGYEFFFISFEIYQKHGRYSIKQCIERGPLGLVKWYHNVKGHAISPI